MAQKKKFIEVEIPILNESTQVLGTNETLSGKTIKLDLSRKLRGKGMEAIFKIMVKENKLVAYPKSMILMRSYVQRMMRKRISYVEDSFDATCKDIKITIKPFLITRKKVSRAIRNNLRKTTKEFLLDYIKDKTYLELAEANLHGTMQKDMHPKLKKVYPLSLCEIRVLETKELDKADLTMKKPVEAEKKADGSAAEEKSQFEEVQEALKAKEAAKKEEVTEETPQDSSSEQEKPKKIKKEKKAKDEPKEDKKE